jgi:hypothetical protein
MPRTAITSGTASLSACAEAASVVTVLLTRDGNALLRKAAARLVLKARENIVSYAIARFLVTFKKTRPRSLKDG